MIASNGCYGVVDLPGWFSACIRTLCRSKWSHAFIVLDAGNGVILQANPEGSATGSLSGYKNLPMLFSEPAPQAASMAPQELISMAQEKWAGIPYGFPTILELGLFYTMHLKPAWLTKLVLDEKEQICSQLVAEWGSAYGADWSCGQADPEFVTPGLLGARLTS